MEVVTLAPPAPSRQVPTTLPERLAAQVSSPWRRVLVAGVGDPFRGDDGFGSEVARRLARRPLPPGVEVVDFSARGLDLVFALRQGYQAALLIDTARRGEAPGTLTVIDTDADRDEERGDRAGDYDVALDPAALDPVGMVRFARLFGHVPRQVVLVVCEPQEVAPASLHSAARPRMSAPVAEAVALAVPLVESLIGDLLAAGPQAPPPAVARSAF
jgi:hydrogenase maturation protease